MNGVYHFHNNIPLSARLGVGVGYVRVSYDIDNAFDEGDGALVYQGFAVIEYAFIERFFMNATGCFSGCPIRTFAMTIQKPKRNLIRSSPRLD